MWPEWNDGDVYREKWDSGKAPDDPKKPPVLNVKETIVKLKQNTNRHLLHFPFFFFLSPLLQLFFEDPEGRVSLPASLNVQYWRRPSEFLVSMVNLNTWITKLHLLPTLNT